MDNKITSIVCPNCGANATNHHNCEYCGSLLVRFADANIDIAQTPYGKNDIILPGMLEHLQRNIELQRINDQYGGDRAAVCTDIYDLSQEDYTLSLASVARSSSLVYHSDGMPVFPLKKGVGLGVIISFTPCIDIDTNPLIEEYNKKMVDNHQKFKNLACFPLFKSYYVNSFKDGDGRRKKAYHYAIDFGEDAEGAARLLSDIFINAYGYSSDSPLEYHTNAGKHEILKSRQQVYSNLDSFGGLSNKTWTWIAIAAVVFVLLFLI